MTLLDDGLGGGTEPTPIGLATTPAGREDRWQPTRAGLVSLWRYWDETFAFHNGRLVLRGPNGSGKSMALELMLPFLLDGDTSPHKLSSAAKPRGTLFSRVMAGSDESTRAGFAWLELRRGDEWFTVGARIRASTSTGRTDRNLFTTSLRVGHDLHLLDDRRSPLSRKDLDDVIGSTGHVTDNAADHREHVRRALFPAFSIDRYESLIGALLSLRREKLSQNLDLSKLSAVLSEALPPLDDHDIAEVAEGFERLDRRRHDIATLEADLEQVAALARRQQRYARSVLARVSGDVVSAESTRDTIVRNRREADDALGALVERLDALAAEATSLRQQVADLEHELRGIRESEAYQEGERLAELRAELTQRKQDLVGLVDSVAALATSLHEARSEADDGAAAVEAARGNLSSVHAELRTSADRVGAASVVPPAVAELDTLAVEDIAEPEGLLRAWAQDRRDAVQVVRDLLASLDQAVHDRTGAETRLAGARDLADERTDEERSAAGVVDNAVARYTDEVVTWATDPVFDTAETQAFTSARRADDPTHAVDTAVAEQRSTRREVAAAARRDIQARRDALVAEADELQREREALAAGSWPEPPAPAWRHPRRNWAGAPLWRLVDVVDGTPDALVDRFEAAMVAAGLADAWVAPDGTVDLGPDVADVILTPGPDRPAAGTLAEVLAPTTEVAVAPDVVQRVLGAIPIADDAATASSMTVAIGRDGSFRLGAAVGRGADGPATLFGAAARERNRLAEIERLDGELATRAGQVTELDRQEHSLDASLAAFDAVLADRPDREPVDDARAEHRDAQTRRVEAERHVVNAQGELTEAESAVRAAQRGLATECSRTGLPSDGGHLHEYETELDRFDECRDVWSRRARELATECVALARADAGLDRAQRAHSDADQRRDRVESDVRALRTRVDAIAQSLGTDFDELLARVEAREAARREGLDRIEAIRSEQPPLLTEQGRLKERVEEADRQLSDAEAHRQRVHTEFAALCAGPLIADAGLDPEPPPDGVTATRDAARRLAGAVRDDPADQVPRRSRAVDELVHTARTAVAGRIDLVREQPSEADWLFLSGTSAGIRVPIGELRTRLQGDLDAARSELHAAEAELFERTLAGSIRSSLADRIRAANGLVDTINAQLDQVRTAAGVGGRLRWHVADDQPPAVRAARSLLLRDPADLTGEERASLQDFVRARVDDARADVELHAPWEARLRDSLDYRQWHTFGLQVSHRDWSGFKPATSSLLQRLSTGERSVALHLPMLASIAAHYADGAGKPLDCPRLILLDELFAGVDQANRSQLFGTFTAWDLDAVFTSDHEWCQYASLDGIAIHHLQAGGDDEPVTSVRFVWDGHERVLAEPDA